MRETPTKRIITIRPGRIGILGCVEYDSHSDHRAYQNLIGWRHDNTFQIYFIVPIPSSDLCRINSVPVNGFSPHGDRFEELAVGAIIIRPPAGVKIENDEELATSRKN